MFYQENKTIFIILILFAFISCNKNRKAEEINFDYLYKKKSMANVQNEYNLIYKKATDSLYQWKKSKLKGFIFLDLYPWKLDSLICFNEDKNKLIGAILVSDNALNNNQGDGIDFFNGVKIRGEWYFFKGASIVLPREFYQKDIHKPLSFEKLHQIALKEVFRGYLIKDAQGEWVVNNAFFDELKIGKGGYWFSRCKTQEDYEKTVDTIVNANWQN